MDKFGHILILLGLAVGMVALFRRFHLPPILGYLFVGMLAGPGGMAFIPSFQDLTFLADFGVVFLMFTIGLEFSLQRILAMKHTLLGLGGLQVFVCTLVATLIGWLLDLPPKTAFVTAGALALSSTAVVVKQLIEQQELHTIHGRLSISILLFQDLAAVLFLILIPAMAGPENTPILMPLLIALSKGIAVCVFLGFLGKWLIRPLFHEVAKAHSSELFMLAALFVVLGASWLTEHVELSMTLGAFLAGLMLGETEFRHQIEIDIRPFKDVLLGLFFIIVGSLFNLSLFPSHWYWVLLLLVALITAKTLLIMGLTKLVAGVTTTKAFRTGLILAQGGEFGFVVLILAVENKLLDPIHSQVVIAAVVLSIVVAPTLIKYNKAIGKWFFPIPEVEPLPQDQDEQPYQLLEHASELKDHVIICGFGRVGQILARFLEQEQIPSVALDLDPMRISTSSLAGEHAFLGDVRHPDVLANAGLGRARMVVISFADEPAALETLQHIRSLRVDVPVFVRTKNDSNLKMFQEAGATEVVPESLEASLMLASHLLLTLGVPAYKILTKIRAIHADRYQMIQGVFRGSDENLLLEDEEESRKSLHVITITENAYAVGKSIQDILNPELPNPIKVLTRASHRFPNPAPEMKIEIGDVLVLYATPETVYILTEEMLRGP